MTKSEKIDLLTRIEFGEIDGYGDPNLDKYFLDNNYWNKIVNDKKFFVVGKKGTGKSAIYRMIKEQGHREGALVENKDFGFFPFEKLLELSDDNFTRPNQYQSIWMHLILNSFAEMIAKVDDSNVLHSEIKDYVKDCLGNIGDLHKDLVTRTTKTSAGLTFKGYRRFKRK